MTTEPRDTRHALREVVVVMAKLGCIAFGGPAVHVAMLREETTQRRRWLTDQEFLDLFAAVSLLPGPSSTQLAIVLSRRRAGALGLIVGGMCFITPAMSIMLALAWAYVRYGTTPTGGGIVYGVEPVVVAVVVVALWELARRAITHRWYLIIAGFSIAGYFVRVNVLLILVAGGLVVTAVANGRRLRSSPAVLMPLVPAAGASTAHPGVAAVLVEFTKLGLVVFGSGYVLLAFLRSDLVEHLGWLTDRQVVDAVAAGQITPGPVFTTATFVGYLLGGVPLAVAATAGIFVPSFLMVAMLEPFVGRIRHSPWLGPALDGIVVVALALMAGVTVDLGRSAITDPPTAFLALAALAVLARWRPNAAGLVLAGAAVGVLHAWL